MTQATTTPSTLTVGIDLGDRRSHVCVLDAAGEIVEESRMSVLLHRLRRQLTRCRSGACDLRGDDDRAELERSQG